MARCAWCERWNRALFCSTQTARCCEGRDGHRGVQVCGEGGGGRVSASCAGWRPWARVSLCSMQTSRCRKGSRGADNWRDVPLLPCFFSLPGFMPAGTALACVCAQTWGGGADPARRTRLARAPPPFPPSLVDRPPAARVRAQILFEEEQILPDGRSRCRNVALSEKLVGDEQWRSAISRAVQEELGSVLPTDYEVGRLGACVGRSV
eukprot:351737-Chlamydomonas_euryale.AAC.3